MAAADDGIRVTPMRANGDFLYLYDGESKDPEWFFGLRDSEAVVSKKAYLGSLGKKRLVNWKQDMKQSFDKAQEEGIIKSFPVVFEKVDEEFKKNDSVHKGYFDRSCDNRLCDTFGQFKCKGEGGGVPCKHNHEINPYDGTQKSVFCNWEFDHIVPRKNIFEALIRDGRKDQERELDWKNLYTLMFTTQNLEFKHKDCHLNGDRQVPELNEEGYFYVVKDLPKKRLADYEEGNASLLQDVIKPPSAKKYKPAIKKSPSKVCASTSDMKALEEQRKIETEIEQQQNDLERKKQKLKHFKAKNNGFFKDVQGRMGNLPAVAQGQLRMDIGDLLFKAELDLKGTPSGSK